MKKNITLQDIADELGLTKVSISKALRDHPDISSETRIKVKEVAKRLGYRPNLVARSLTSSRSKTIGLIIPKIAHFFFATVVESIYKTAFENGYEVIIGVSLEDEELERKHIETMLQMRVDGLLISVTEQTRDAKRFEAVRKMGINLVFFDRGIKDAGFSYIKGEDRNSAKKGVLQLINQGYKNIAHLAGYEYVEIGKSRKQGYLDALEYAGIPVDDNIIIEGGYSEEDGFESFQKLLDKSGLPEAVFAVTYPVGLGILKNMKANGINPDLVQILAFGRSDFNDYLVAPFMCIEQPTSMLGIKAVEQLLKEIEEGKKVKPTIIELPAG